MAVARVRQLRTAAVTAATVVARREALKLAMFDTVCMFFNSQTYNVK